MHTDTRHHHQHDDRDEHPAGLLDPEFDQDLDELLHQLDGLLHLLNDR